MNTIRIDEIGRGTPRRPLVKIAPGGGLEFAAKITRPIMPDVEAVGSVLLLTDSGPAEVATAWRDMVRSRRGPVVYFADMLAMDVSSADAVTAEIGVLLDQVSAPVLIIDSVDVLPIEERALTFALRRLASGRPGVTAVFATAARR